MRSRSIREDAKAPSVGISAPGLDTRPIGSGRQRAWVNVRRETVAGVCSILCWGGRARGNPDPTWRIEWTDSRLLGCAPCG
jgi:hypothetical protein